MEIDKELFYSLKDRFMLEFIKDDLDTLKKCIKDYQHPDDVKYNKKLLKAYKCILKYYEVV